MSRKPVMHLMKTNTLAWCGYRIPITHHPGKSDWTSNLGAVTCKRCLAALRKPR